MIHITLMQSSEQERAPKIIHITLMQASQLVYKNVPQKQLAARCEYGLRVEAAQS
jgi:hypothetical protein